MKWHGNLLYVKDLAASVRFYSEVLGLPVVARPAPHMAIIALGNGVLYLHEDPTDAPAWLERALEADFRGVGIIAHIEVADVEAHGQVQLYVYDPSGYNLVFVQRVGATAEP